MRVGLALSGGGARGLAHFGVLKALEELGVEVHEIAGTSAGAIAGAFYANGYSPEEAMKHVSSTSLFKVVWPAFSWRGLFNISKAEEVFRKYFENDSFENTRMPFRVVATNLNSGQREVFSEGPLVRPMMASCCLPFIFDPVEINGQLYVDGGIVNNLPAEVLKETCDIVIGVNVVPVIHDDDLSGMKKMIERISMVAISANVNSSRKQCDVLIEPRELRSFGTFDLKQAQGIFDIGYESTHHLFELDREESPVKSLLKI